MGQLARPVHQLVVVPPVIEPEREADDADRPPEDACRRRGLVGIGEQPAGGQAEEADMEGAQHLVRQGAGIERDQLEGAEQGEKGEDRLDIRPAPRGAEQDPDQPERKGDADQQDRGQPGQRRHDPEIERDAEGGDDLEGGEGDGDPEQQAALPACAEGRRQAVFRVMRHGRCGAGSVRHGQGPAGFVAHASSPSPSRLCAVVL
jgi:hypothetical protein